MRISIKYYVLCIMHMSFGLKGLLKLLAFLLLTTYYILHTTPVRAEVNIGDKFGFGNIKSVGEATNRGIPTLFSLLAAIVVIYFLWGAFKYIISAGNKEATAEARGMITHAIIGFIILIFAFLILQFLLSSLFNITSLQIIK